MPDTPAFKARQYEFAAHIRDPERNAAPAGVEDRRMAIYRDLFFNNLFKLLGSTFPVLRKLYGDAQWRRLVRAFMAGYRSQTPYFLEIPREFVTFLQNSYEPQAGDPPFLLELAHYEWAELALSVSDASDDLSDVDPDGDLLDGVPAKSSLAWSLTYRYPVHRISASYRPAEPPAEPTCLVVYRNADDELGFKELNPLTARLLELVAGNDANLSGRELLSALASETGYPDPAALQDHGHAALREMRDAGILTGARRRRAGATRDRTD